MDGVRDRPRSRRQFLAGAGTGLALAAAGCLGGGPADGNVTTATETLPAPFLGDADAPVTVAVYKDFACPHCATFAAEAEPAIVGEYVDPGVVRLEHRDFPLPVAKPTSYTAPNAARAVQAAAGDEAFFAYAKRLFANQGSLGVETYGELAEEVDAATVRRAARNRVYGKTISDDRSTGRDRGVRGTPAVFVGDRQLQQWSGERFSSAVEAERADDG